MNPLERLNWKRSTNQGTVEYHTAMKMTSSFHMNMSNFRNHDREGEKPDTEQYLRNDCSFLKLKNRQT